MYPIKNLICLSTLLVIAVSAASHTGDDDQIAAVNRHSLMMVMGWGMKPIADMYAGKATFDAELAALQATRLVQLAEMIAPIFSRNTAGKKVSTSTLDLVWETPEDFRLKTENLLNAAIDYREATGQGEASARQAFKPLADGCKGCHEDYKSE